MSKLESGQGTLDMVIEIKRAATGQVDKFHVVGAATPEEAEEIAKAVNLPLQDGDLSKP